MYHNTRSMENSNLDGIDLEFLGKRTKWIRALKETTFLGGEEVYAPPPNKY